MMKDKKRKMLEMIPLIPSLVIMVGLFCNLGLCMARARVQSGRRDQTVGGPY